MCIDIFEAHRSHFTCLSSFQLWQQMVSKFSAFFLPKLTLFIFFSFAWETTNQIIYTNTHKTHIHWMVQHAQFKNCQEHLKQQQNKDTNFGEEKKSWMEILNCYWQTDKIAKVIQFHLLWLDRHNRSVVTYSFVSLSSTFCFHSHFQFKNQFAKEYVYISAATHIFINEYVTTRYSHWN